jgi:hypothetical protein
MTRHQRRKAAKANAEARLERLITAAIADRNAKIVRGNLSNPRRPHRSAKGMGNRGIYRGDWSDFARGRGAVR